MDDEPKCPECGSVVNLNTDGFLLMGRRTVKCDGCGVELVATAQVGFR